MRSVINTLRIINFTVKEADTPRIYANPVILRPIRRRWKKWSLITTAIWNYNDRQSNRFFITLKQIIAFNILVIFFFVTLHLWRSNDFIFRFKKCDILFGAIAKHWYVMLEIDIFHVKISLPLVFEISIWTFIRWSDSSKLNNDRNSSWKRSTVSIV
jgi:hypothetical protein